jgi:uncharacterized protein YcgI (DUF1989 family)
MRSPSPSRSTSEHRTAGRTEPKERIAFELPALHSDRAREVMTIAEDTSGRHDLLAGSCSEGHGVEKALDHRSNLEAGVPLSEAPYTFNIFMNVEIAPSGQISVEGPLSKPADHIDLRTEKDLIVAFSNCPQARSVCNRLKATSLRLRVYGVHCTSL